VGGLGGDRHNLGGGNDLANTFAWGNVFEDPGDDRIDGGAGDEALNGWDGSDELIGGDGVDRCEGGDGTDVAASCETVIGVP